MKIRLFLPTFAIVILAIAFCDKSTKTENPSVAGKSSAADKSAKWSLIKKQDFDQAALRGYGKVSGTFWVSNEGGSILEIVCENKSNAQLTQAKYLSDIQLLPRVKSSVPTKSAGKIFTVKIEDQGQVAALRYDKKVFIVSAPDQRAFDKLVAECVAQNGKNFISESQVGVPMWLDRWDKYGFRFYYRAGELPEGKTAATYNVFDEFDFAQKSDHCGFVFWGDQNSVDTAEGLNNDLFWNWGLQAATQRKLPFGLNLGLGMGEWLFNRYREQTEVKAPQFCGNSYRGVASYDLGGRGHFSWNATTGKDAELGVSQKLVRAMSKLPNITTILEPHGELSHNTEIFMEYGPLADVSYRSYLESKYKTVSALQSAWGVKIASWDEVHVPEVASFLGWTGDAIDLRGEWKVGYEQFSNGQDYSDEALRFGLGNTVVPTEKAPDAWTAEKFDDTSWPTVLAPGHDRTMFLPQRPAVYRRTFNVPREWLATHSRAWIYVWDLNNGARNIVKVTMNGKTLGESEVTNNVPHWCVMEATGALKAGANQLSLRLPKGILGYRVYLSAEEPKQYPNLGEGKNMQWVDFARWSVDSRIHAVQRGAEMIRQANPNVQIDFMAPGGYGDGIKKVAQMYGGNFKNTGYMGAFWADDLPAQMRGAGLPFSLEPGGPAADLEGFKKVLGLWQTEGIQGLDYFIHVGSIMWHPEIRKHFEDTLPLTRFIGKYHAPKAEIATLDSTLGVALTGYPWGKDCNTNLPSGYWNWNVRANLMGLYESDMLSESSFESGDAARYRVIIDSNTSIMDEEMVSQIEKYVRDGGVFVTFVQTGRHSPAKKDSWPISRLTGYEVAKIDPLNPEGTPEETHRIQPVQGQTVFSGDWDVAANGLSLKKTASDAQDLMMWEDGATAVGMRPLGKGFIVQVGCNFFGKNMHDRIESKPSPNQAALTQLFSQLLQSFQVSQIEARLSDKDHNVILRHYVSNNGLYDVWTLWNRDGKQAVTKDLILPSSVSSRWAWEVQSKKMVPIAQGKLPVKLEPLETQILLTPCGNIAHASLDWFELQRNWWRGTTPPPTKNLESPSKFSMDLNADWAFKPLATGEKISADLLKADADTTSWEKVHMGIWSATHPNVKHGLLRKTFTVPPGWSGGKVGLWIKLWWNKTFLDKGRAYLDGELVGDWNADGLRDANPNNVLQPGTTHTLAVEVEGEGSLVGSKGAAWLWVWPKPLQVLNLAGEWSASNDVLDYRNRVKLPGEYTAKAFRRTVNIPRSMASNNAVLNVDAEGGWGVLGVIVNGYFIAHDISDLHFQINMTPWIRFGEDNEIELVNHDNRSINIKDVSIEFHKQGMYP